MKSILEKCGTVVDSIYLVQDGGSGQAVTNTGFLDLTAPLILSRVTVSWCLLIPGYVAVCGFLRRAAFLSVKQRFRTCSAEGGGSMFLRDAAVQSKEYVIRELRGTNPRPHRSSFRRRGLVRNETKLRAAFRSPRVPPFASSPSPRLY